MMYFFFLWYYLHFLKDGWGKDAAIGLEAEKQGNTCGAARGYQTKSSQSQILHLLIWTNMPFEIRLYLLVCVPWPRQWFKRSFKKHWKLINTTCQTLDCWKRLWICVSSFVTIFAYKDEKPSCFLYSSLLYLTWITYSSYTLLTVNTLVKLYKFCVSGSIFPLFKYNHKRAARCTVEKLLMSSYLIFC